MKVAVKGFGWQGALILLILVPIYILSFVNWERWIGKTTLYLGNCGGQQKSGCVLTDVRKLVFDIDTEKQTVNGENCVVSDRDNWSCRRENGEGITTEQIPYYEFGFKNGEYAVESIGVSLPGDLVGGVVATKADWLKFRCRKWPLLVCAPVAGLF